MSYNRIVTAERAIFAERCILLGRDAAGAVVLGLPVKPKSAYRWARAGSPADRKRLQGQVDELNKESEHEQD